MFGRSFDILLNAAFVNGDGSSKPTRVTDGADTGTTADSATAANIGNTAQSYHTAIVISAILMGNIFIFVE